MYKRQGIRRGRGAGHREEVQKVSRHERDADPHPARNLRFWGFPLRVSLRDTRGGMSGRNANDAARQRDLTFIDAGARSASVIALRKNSIMENKN